MSLARNTKQRSVIVIGHSHGGWLALKLAASLPPDIQLDYLVTIDPISRSECPPMYFGASVAAKYIGDPYHRGCEQFPSDIRGETQKRIAGRSKAWLHFYQSQTADLHSDGSPYAQVSKELRIDDEELGKAHGLIPEAPELWSIVSPIILNQQQLIEPEFAANTQPTPPDVSPIKLVKKPYAAKLFLRYRNAVAMFYRSKSSGSRNTAFQSNNEPTLGLELGISPNISASYARSVALLEKSHRHRGKHSKAQVIDARYVKERWEIDVFAHEYKALFRERFGGGDVRPFRDRFFRDGGDITPFPHMRMRGLGLDVIYTTRPETFSNLSSSYNTLATRSGWSPTIFANLQWTELRNNGPILPDDLTEDGKLKNLRGYQSTSLTIMPGLASALVHGHWYAVLVGTYGYGYQHLNYSHAATPESDLLATKAHVFSNLGYKDEDHFLGTLAYLTNVSSNPRGLHLTESIAALEIYYGRRF